MVSRGPGRTHAGVSPMASGRSRREQASRGSGGTTADRPATPGTEAPVFCSKAAATEGWCCSADLGLWLGISLLIPRAHVSLRGSEARECRSGLRGQSLGRWKLRALGTRCSRMEDLTGSPSSRAPPGGQGSSPRHSQGITHGSHRVASRDRYQLF